MRKFMTHKMGWISLCSLILLGVCAGTLLLLQHHTLATTVKININVNSLLPGPDELPGDFVLQGIKQGKAVRKFMSFSSEAQVSADWLADVVKEPSISSAKGRQSINLVIAIASDLSEAQRIALAASKQVAMNIPEVKVDTFGQQFADRVWYSGSRLIFTRANIVCDLHYFNRQISEAEAKQNLVALARRVAQKADALLAGHPTAIPALPFALSELAANSNLQSLWNERHLSQDLWGTGGTAILVEKDGLLRIIPAMKLTGSDDYLAPLKYLLPLVDQTARLKISPEQTVVKILGQTYTFHHGSQQVERDTTTLTLPSQVTYEHGQVLISLASLNSLLPQPIRYKAK